MAVEGASAPQHTSERGLHKDNSDARMRCGDARTNSSQCPNSYVMLMYMYMTVPSVTWSHA